MPKLVLLSGLLCDDRIWSDVAGLLSDAAETRIISFPNFSSIGDMADHVLAEAPDGRFALAGHSMGGRVALEVVRRAPDRISALALLNTGIHPRSEKEIEGRQRLLRIAREKGMGALAMEWLPPMLGAPPARIAEVMPDLLAMVEANTPESFAGQIRALLDRPDAAAVLPTIEVPVLLSSATNDQWSPISQHEAMTRHLRAARLVAIEEAGHMMPIEQPVAVAAALRNWILE